jgi:hypothetical protein
MDTEQVPSKIVFVIDKPEVVAHNTSDAVSQIEQQVLRFLKLDQDLSDLPTEEKATRGLLERVPAMSFSIHGYDHDPKPLWRCEEVRGWGWAWLRQQPYCILLLDDPSSILLSLLCLGGSKSSIPVMFPGFIPDVRSGRAEEFLCLVDSGLGVLLEAHGNTHVLAMYATDRHASLMRRFHILRNEFDSLVQRRWWRFWR